MLGTYLSQDSTEYYNKAPVCMCLVLDIVVSLDV